MLSKTIYTEADGTILVVFKNLAGLIHRDNGPAVIRITARSYNYKYYQNGRAYRPSKNGIDQPAEISKFTNGDVYHTYYNNGTRYIERGNGGNLPYVIFKCNSLNALTLTYKNYYITQYKNYKQIKTYTGGAIRNFNQHVYAHAVTYKLTKVSIKELGPNYIRSIIPPELAKINIGTMPTRDCGLTPLESLL